MLARRRKTSSGDEEETELGRARVLQIGSLTRSLRRSLGYLGGQEAQSWGCWAALPDVTVSTGFTVPRLTHRRSHNMAQTECLLT